MCFKKFFAKKNRQIEPYISQDNNSFNYSGNDYAENINSDSVHNHEYEAPVSHNAASFTLTEFGGEIEGGFREIENPTKDELERAIKNIVFYDGDFFTLISDEPINGFTMLEGQVFYGENLITTSAHVEFTTDKGKVVKAYDKSSVSSAGLLEMLTDFMNGRTPDINDGNWKFDEIVYNE